MATQVTFWKSVDGKIFDTLEEALAWEKSEEFRKWCQYNICCGGHWTASMVAEAILEQWDIKAKE